MSVIDTTPDQSQKAEKLLNMSDILHSIKHFLKNYDTFGHPINMKVHGESTFKTVPGGCVTLILHAILIW